MIAKMFCVKASHISTHLLSDEDKQDMLNGDLSIEALAAHVKVWKRYGQPDYAHGKTDGLIWED